MEKENHKKSVASLMHKVGYKNIHIKESRRQLTLDGNEELEVEGMAKIDSIRIHFRVVIPTKYMDQQE